MKLTDVTKDLFDYLILFRQKVEMASVPDPNAVLSELESVFYGMEETISENRRLANEYKQVKYPLVVFADEVILTSSWPHAKKWEQMLLEKKYYSSNIGGNQFFRLLSKVEKMPTSVITVFFYCLAFGFRGGFEKNDPSLFRLKGRLLHRIQPSRDIEEAKILPDTYRVNNAAISKLPKLRKWRNLLIAAIVVFIVLLSLERLVVWPLVMGQSLKTEMALEVDSDSEVKGADLSGSAVSEVASGYTVQLGSFSNETLALHVARQNQQRGVTTRIYYKTESDGSSQFSVLTGNFSTEDEAQRVLDEARRASEIVSEMTVISLDKVAGECIHGCE